MTKNKFITIFLIAISTLYSLVSYAQSEVKIGNQIWTTENLNVSKFRNGEIIPEAKTESEWKAYGQAGEAAWRYLKFNKTNGKKYGKLYNWYAVNDPRGIAPNGFHPAKDEEWTQLIEFIGGSSKATVKLKSKDGWINFINNEDGGGTNSTGFTALPSTNPPYLGEFWTSNEKELSDVNINFPNAWYFKIQGGSSAIFKEDGPKYLGLSVRCVKD